jgi:flagellar motor switch protein FliN/FliY
MKGISMTHEMVLGEALAAGNDVAEEVSKTAMNLIGLGKASDPGGLERVLRIPLSLKVLLGSASMPIYQVTKLGRGAVIPLDRKVGDPVDVMINGRIIAKGEIVVLDEEGSRFGVTLTEMIDNTKL